MTMRVSTWRIQKRCGSAACDKLVVSTFPERLPARQAAASPLPDQVELLPFQELSLHLVCTFSKRLPAREAAASPLPDQVELLPFRELSLHLVCRPLKKALPFQLLYLFPDRPTGDIQWLVTP